MGRNGVNYFKKTTSETGWKKESGSFSEEKEPKRLYDSGPWALNPSKPMAQGNKSFLRRFFSKKRLLP
jgi:hypothetical protein